MVKEDFTAGTTGAGVGHLPKIVTCVARTLVVANADNALHRHANFFFPDGVGLVVVLVDRHPEFFFGKAIDLGKQGPGKENSVFFEIVAKREVTQHLEKRVVPCRVAHVL